MRIELDNSDEPAKKQVLRFAQDDGCEKFTNQLTDWRV